MKQIITIPRLYIPRGDFEKWSVIAGDRFAYDSAYWNRLKEEVGGAPSALRFVFSEAVSEEDEDFPREAQACQYVMLEEECIEKFTRGSVLAERHTSAGIRRGIVACIDLEAYTDKRGESSPVRPLQEADGVCVERLLKLRRGAPLEFSHVAVLYKDPKNKLMKSLLKEDLEELYDFKLSGDGGRLRGLFLPDYLAEDVVRQLPSRGEPCFAVADGCSSLSAAKRYWEELKEGLSSKEKLFHPARFALVEFLNVYDDAVRVLPVNRVLIETETGAFCDYFSSSVKCSREGNVLYCAKPTTAELFAEVNGIIETYLRANGGRVLYVSGEKQAAEAAARKEGAALVFRPFDRDGLFSSLSGGKLFPKKSFALGEEGEARYYTEGREIGYD